MDRPAVFLDKDGTLIEDVPYNVDPERIRLAAGVAEGLPRLRSAGFRLILVSTRSGVARGSFPGGAIGPVRERLRELVAGVGAEIEGFYYCPHHPEGAVPRYSMACGGRKPEPGRTLEAARDHDIDLDRSWFVGDILDDVEAGRRAGCR